MKTIKFIGYGLLALIVLFIVLAFVLPTEQNIVVEKKFNFPKHIVFNAINDLRAHEKWTPFMLEDDTATIVLGDKVVGQDASYTWTSSRQGNGTFTISESDSEKGINTQVNLANGKIANGMIGLENVDDETMVNWNFDFTSGRFSNVLMPIFKIKMKSTFERGLDNLEKLIEKRMKSGEYYNYSVAEDIIPLQYFITKRAEVDASKMQQFYASNLSSLFSTLQDADQSMQGKPCGLIYNFNALGNKIDMAAAIPVAESVDIDGASQQTISAGKAITVDFYGDYQDISKAHDAIQAYMQDRELVYNWPVIEEYITDPSIEQDPAKWLTKISYPVGN